MEQKPVTVEYTRTQQGHFWPITAKAISNQFNLGGAVSIEAGTFGLMKERAHEQINAALEKAGYPDRLKPSDIAYRPKF